MKYSVVKTNINAPLEKGTLTNKGRITDTLTVDGDNKRLPLEDINYIIVDDLYFDVDLQPIKIQLREVSFRKEPEQTNPKKYSGISTEWLAWKKYEDSLKVYEVSDELADAIMANNLMELEEDTDFKLEVSVITFSGNDLGEEGKDWFWEARPIKKEEELEDVLFGVAQEYAIKSHSPSREARRIGFVDGAKWGIDWQQKYQEEQFLSDKVNYLMVNAMRRLSQQEMILLRDKLSRRLPSADSETELQEIEPPVGDFIIKNAQGVMGNNGMLYHYAEVCNLLNLYKKHIGRP